MDRTHFGTEHLQHILSTIHDVSNGEWKHFLLHLLSKIHLWKKYIYLWKGENEWMNDLKNKSEVARAAWRTKTAIESHPIPGDIWCDWACVQRCSQPSSAYRLLQLQPKIASNSWFAVKQAEGIGHNYYWHWLQPLHSETLEMKR